MKQIIVLPSFERCLKRLDSATKRNVAESLSKFNEFLCTGNFQHGLGYKKLAHLVYEIRVDIKVRIIIEEDDQAYYFVLVGSHDDVKKYLR